MLQATPLESVTLYVSKPLLENGVIRYCKKWRKVYILYSVERYVDSKPNSAQAVAIAMPTAPSADLAQ